MGSVLTADVGRIWIPEKGAYTVGPAFPSGHRRPYAGVVTVRIQPGRGAYGEGTGTREQRSYGVAGPSTEGLHLKWAATEELQRLFAKPGDFARAVEIRMFKGVIHRDLFTGRHARELLQVASNERGQYGGRMMAKLAYGFVSSPTNATVQVPTYVCVNKTSTFTAANFTWAKCGGSQSLSDGVANLGANVTTNEFTANGLTRAIGTLSGYADPSALDGIFAGTIQKVFTVITGAATFYGLALADNTSGAFNLFAESAQTSAVLQISDTLTATWTINN